MARRLVLHVGLMKSGTSFIQKVMQGNAAELRRRGVLFPTPWAAQVRGVREVAERGGPRQRPLDPDGPWQRLLREVAAWPDTAVLSMEFLGPRQPGKIRHILSTLPEGDVQVVLSVRDLARTIPAMWQENVQNWGRLSWEEYLAGVREESREPDAPGSGFWQRQDASGIAARWLEAVGPGHLTLLTVPRPGAPAELLWERFASVVGVDPAGLDLDVRSNPSLGLPSLLVLRALNERLRESDPPLTGREYDRTVKQLLAKRGLAPRREPRLGYDTTWVVERGAQEIDRLRALGVPVVGDLAELRCEDVPGVSPDAVTTEEQLAAALDALALVTDRLARARGARKAGKGTA